MAAQIWKNNFDSIFAVAAGTGDTSIRLASSATALLGSLTGGDWMILTCYKRSGSVESDIEIVKVTNVDPNSGGDCILTVVRAQEGTVAKAYSAGDLVSMRLTAGGLNATASDSELAAHTGDTANPHAVTKTQVGLGNVDNTADSSKPVSTLQQTALDLKISTSAKDASGGVPGLTLFKINLRNAANTITSWFTNAATVARTWTMPDKDGTVAMISDITGGTSAGSFTSLSASGNVTLGDVSTDTVSIPGTLTSGKHTAKQSAETGSAFGLTAERSTNDSFIAMGYHSTGDSFRVQASYTSTGAYKPLTFWTLDNERMRIGTDGAVTIPYSVGIGTGATPTGPGQLVIKAGVDDMAIAVKSPYDSSFLFSVYSTGETAVNGGLSITGGTLGYGTGAGGTVTQATSKSTGVELNKPCGNITMHNEDLLSGATVGFYLTNSLVSDGDVVVVNTLANANYQVWAASVYNSTVLFNVKNLSAGSLSDALQISFALIKGATA